jgi:hypothetical protein
VNPVSLGFLLILFAVVIYLIMIAEVIPSLWPNRDRPLVRVLFALFSGGHLEELFQEAGMWLFGGVTVHVDPVDEAGEHYLQVLAHTHDGLPAHSH